ncbi:MAG: alkaline phosphatase D family protein [Deferribacteres bacterium]|nr:alkaline phosphatase D family protein [candidate division KSB1 bacterium]MCB9501133.1 alkaline phosphatase D family protein [Deferribacteres bacterium]
MHIKRITVLLFLFLSGTALAQHDPGRNAVRLIATKKIKDARELVAQPPRKMNSPIDAAERFFVLALAACVQRDSVAALQYAQQAIRRGLPVERLQAGPRIMLQNLQDYSAFKGWMKAQEKALVHGPLLGAVTDSKARFWVRTANESKVRIEIRPGKSSNGENVLGSETGLTSESEDFTSVVSLAGLAPETHYDYKVYVDDQPVSAEGTFRTFPREHVPARFRIAFGGGAGYTPQNERMWTTLQSHDLTALLLLGDNVYIDDPEHVETQRYCYYRRQSQPDWRQLTASLPVFSIYDDHDFATNDCVPGAEIDKPLWKRSVWQVFKQNWNNPNYGGGEKQPGCWYDFYIGDVHFIMLDCRYYRDLEKGSMLGVEQKKWLFSTLFASRGRFKLLVSSVPWSPGVKPGSKDTWDGFAKEREEIFSTIEKYKINGLLLLSADRHRTDMRKIYRKTGYDFYDLMSSKLTNVHTHDLVQNAEGSEFIMGYNADCSFGFLEFDTMPADPQVKFSIVNIDNEIIDSRILQLSQLSNKK